MIGTLEKVELKVVIVVFKLGKKVNEDREFQKGGHYL